MKKYLFLSLLLVGVLLGCSKNSDEEQETRSQINKIENLQNPGESGNAFLANTNYDKIIIEIAYVTGFKPSDGALEDFVTFIKQHSFKEDIRMVYKELSSPNKEELSLQEINDIEQENRTLYNQDKTLTFYIYFTDAPSNEDNKEERILRTP